jgi:hypothetical protein
MRYSGRLFQAMCYCDCAGKSAGCPAFLLLGRGGEESRPYNHLYISRKPRPYVGGELHLSAPHALVMCEAGLGWEVVGQWVVAWRGNWLGDEDSNLS